MWFVHYFLIAAHSVKVIKIVEQKSSENHSFLMWFVNHRLIAAYFIEVIKIVEQNSYENHLFLMWFVHYSLITAHSVEVIKIVEQNSLENYSFLMCSSCCLQFYKISSTSSKWLNKTLLRIIHFYCHIVAISQV